MGHLQGGESLRFLVEAYRSTEDVNSKLVIARAIKNHGEQGNQELLRLQQEAHVQSNENENTLLNQVFSEAVVLPV